jgi:hypothetical protein
VEAGQTDHRQLDPARHRDLEGRTSDPWIRRAGLAVMLAIAVAALLNVFGQEPDTSTASGPAASLEVNAPSNVRGGLLFQARLDVLARREIREPRLILDRGWFESLTLNTTEPGPKEETTDNGRVVLSYDTIPARRSLIVWLEFQANPTNLGRQDQDVELYDGETKLVHAEHTLTVFP